MDEASWFDCPWELRTAEEAAFVDALRQEARAGLVEAGVCAVDTQVWTHTYADGTPWLLAHVDDARSGYIAATYRVDFDGYQVCGGRSPSSLNGDAGVPAREAQVDLDPPSGFQLALQLSLESARFGAKNAAEWRSGRLSVVPSRS